MSDSFKVSQTNSNNADQGKLTCLQDVRSVSEKSHMVLLQVSTPKTPGE